MSIAKLMVLTLIAPSRSGARATDEITYATPSAHTAAPGQTECSSRSPGEADRRSPGSGTTSGSREMPSEAAVRARARGGA